MWNELQKIFRLAHVSPLEEPVKVTDATYNCTAGSEETFAYEAILNAETSSSQSHRERSSFNFFTDFLGMIPDYRNPMSKMLFSDEANVHVSGKENTHNCSIWALKNPKGFFDLHEPPRR
jgi:hypothetical protein